MRGLSKFPVAWSPGELDGSGRYYTDEELAAGAATGGIIGGTVYGNAAGGIGNGRQAAPGQARKGKRGLAL